MTIRDLSAAMLRRWYVVAVVMLLAASGGYLLEREKGVYASETVVSFFHPGETNLSRYSGLDDTNLIAFAGLVARELGNGKASAIYSEDAAPSYGAGIRQGVVITLPNAGNQWVTSYQRAEIILRIVGPSEQWVARTQGELLRRVVQISEARQSSVTAEAVRIRASPVPQTKQIIHVAPSRADVMGALFALLLAGLILGGWGAVLIDRAVRGWKMRSRRHEPPRVANEGPEL